MVDWERIAGAAKVLVIDGDPVARQGLVAMLEGGGYRNIWTAPDPAGGQELFEQVQPDLVLTELRTSAEDGLEVLRLLHESIPSETFVPVMVVTDDGSDQARLNALLLGATDFVTKPIDIVETMLRIRLRLETRYKFLELERTVQRLRGPYG